MKLAIISLIIVAWITSFLLSLVWVWLVAQAYNHFGLLWTASGAATVAVIGCAIRMRDRAGGQNE